MKGYFHLNSDVDQTHQAAENQSELTALSFGWLFTQYPEFAGFLLFSDSPRSCIN